VPGLGKAEKSLDVTHPPTENPPGMPQVGATLTSNVPFLPDHRSERLDLWLPDPALFGGPRPAVVLIHGGGWAKGDKAEYRQRQTAEWLASEGYAVLSVNYLLSKFAGEILKSQPTRSCWPECLHDCRAALLMAGERAKLWNIDPNRISLLGFSAGAHLALLTAVTNGHPELDRHGGKATAACVLAFYGIYDLHPLASRWCFGEPAENPQQLQRQASPVSYLHANVPPVFLAHGESDKTVPVQQTSLLAEKLAELKVPHDVILLPKAPHGFRITSEFGDLRPSVLAFLEAHSS
jgi:acetyl esterase/lipase